MSACKDCQPPQASADNTTFAGAVDRWDSTFTGLPRGPYFVRITATNVQLARKPLGPWLTLTPTATNEGTTP